MIYESVGLAGHDAVGYAVKTFLAAIAQLPAGIAWIDPSTVAYHYHWHFWQWSPPTWILQCIRARVR